jgi:hypothetical protein
MIGFKKYWYGKECEGRLTDVETLFICDIDELSLEDIDLAPHIYFCSGAVEQLLEEDAEYDIDWDVINEIIDEKQLTISLEVEPDTLSDIPPMIRIKTHIMYMMVDPDISLLKKNDSIKVVYADYSLYCSSIQNMQHVTPDDYKYDRP